MTSTGHDTLGTRSTFDVGGRSYFYYSLAKAAEKLGNVDKLPFSMKVLLENLLRFEDGVTVTIEDVQALVDWQKERKSDREIQYRPARVLMQDFTGVPCVVDLAAMRDAITKLGGDAAKINPLVPVHLVIDHSVMVDEFGTPQAFHDNVELEYQRNGERYEFLKWGSKALDNFKVVPPGTGICHQVNLEHIAQAVWTSKDASGETVAYPDTCVGTDSHTTMVNGLGVLGWGVGGIEAEAAMLGQPVSMLIPKVVGFKLSGSIPPGVTATDVVLTITQMVRKHGVVGKFVEFYGEGVTEVPLANRATIGNMSPEFGSTAAMFPIDDVTLDYLRLTGRSDEQVALVEAYSKLQKLWHDPALEPTFSEYLELDLATVVPSIAGPKRPQDRVELSNAKSQFEIDLNDYATQDLSRVDAQIEETFPASDPPSFTPQDEDRAHEVAPSHVRHAPASVAAPTAVTTPEGLNYTLDHGAVAVAAITSCTNTSNPSVMLAAGLLARNAVKKGLSSKPWVKTSLAPGSKVVTDYFKAAKVMDALQTLRFNVVGFGCTTCIGNSGPLPQPVAEAVEANKLVVA